MIRTTRNILLSAALLAASATAAQKVTISFPFRTPVGELPAGKYTIDFHQIGSGKYLQLRNLATGAGTLFRPTNPVLSYSGTEQPRLIFACADSGCSLKRIWESGASGFDFRPKKLSPAESERLAVVKIEPHTAE
jgi:hypothetical protein